MVSSIVFDSCKENLKPVVILAPNFQAPLTDDLTELKRRLEGLHAPVSVSFCSSVLYDPRFDGVRERNPFFTNTAPDCGSHEALIVGKKMIKGKCHVLLRNSWGSGFNRATRWWKCLCRDRKTGAFKDDCTAPLFNSGKLIVEGCWIDEESLAKNIFGMTSLGVPEASLPQQTK